MNKDKLKKLIYDLEQESKEIDKSIRLFKKYIDDREMKTEFSNSLKYKYLSLFILYEDFISMLLKEHSLYKIGMTVDGAIKKLNEEKILTEEITNYLNTARLLRNRIGHRYKQPKIEEILEFLENNTDTKNKMEEYIKSYLK
ncbi:MAG: hypothetical protein ACRDAU_06670 [Clostridium sp.]